MDFLKTLIIVSEKAKNIARVCRQNQHLFNLLIQRKDSDEANPRFVDDFKTLADVLIQEMVKHDVKSQFQDMCDILGEESNTFENKLGEKICVEIKNSEVETAALLEDVLNEDHIAAALLAAEVHKEIDTTDLEINIPDDIHISLEKMGIWIDPIDCTAEYIHGNEGDHIEDLYLNGLKCVTILIGVFDKESGNPVIGVINRPFEEELSKARCIWGVSLGGIQVNNVNYNNTSQRTVCISNSERTEIKDKLKESGFQLIEASGAGYKILTVVLGYVDAYLLTKGTTFKWDTCAPHSILKSLGGDIVDFQEAIQNNPRSIQYFINGDKCNTNGIIAYKCRKVLDDIINVLK